MLNPHQVLDRLLVQYKKDHPEQRSETLLDVLARDVFLENKQMDYDTFEVRLMESWQVVGRMVHRVQASIAHTEKGKLVHWEIPRIPEAFLERYHREHDTLNTKLESLRLTLEAVPAWISQPEMKFGEYTFAPTLFPNLHGEAILGMEIRRNKKVIGSLGGYLFFRNRKPTFLNINVQGVPKEVGEVERLNAQLGESWRIFFVKKFRDMLEKKGYRVMGGHNYLRLAESLERSEKRLSYFRQYNQTYRRAGFKPLRGHVPLNKDIWITPGSKGRKKPVSSAR